MLELHGELDAEHVPAFDAVVERSLRMRPRRLTIDLRELVSLTDDGLDALAAARDRAADQGSQLRLVRGRGAVQRLFEHTEAVADFEFTAPPPRMRFDRRHEFVVRDWLRRLSATP